MGKGRIGPVSCFWFIFVQPGLTLVSQKTKASGDVGSDEDEGQKAAKGKGKKRQRSPEEESVSLV